LEENPRKWLTKISSIIDLTYGEKSNQNLNKIRTFSLGLTGTAEQWFDHLPKGSKEDLKILIGHFEKKFISDQHSTNYSRMVQRVQKEDENASTYGYALLELIECADPKMSEESRILKFISGLKPELKRNLLQTPSKTFEEAMDAAMKAEVIEKEVSSGEKRKREEDEKKEVEKNFMTRTELEARLTELEEGLGTKIRKIYNESTSQQWNSEPQQSYQPRIPSQRRNPPPPPRFSPSQHSKFGNRRPTCYYCGKVGHIQRNCWKKEEQIRSQQSGNQNFNSSKSSNDANSRNSLPSKGRKD